MSIKKKRNTMAVQNCLILKSVLEMFTEGNYLVSQQ